MWARCPRSGRGSRRRQSPGHSQVPRQGHGTGGAPPAPPAQSAGCQSTVRDGPILLPLRPALSLLRPEPKSKFSLLRHTLAFSQRPETLVGPEGSRSHELSDAGRVSIPCPAPLWWAEQAAAKEAGVLQGFPCVWFRLRPSGLSISLYCLLMGSDISDQQGVISESSSPCPQPKAPTKSTVKEAQGTDSPTAWKLGCRSGESLPVRTARCSPVHRSAGELTLYPIHVSMCVHILTHYTIPWTRTLSWGTHAYTHTRTPTRSHSETHSHTYTQSHIYTQIHKLTGKKARDNKCWQGYGRKGKPVHFW